MKRLAFVGVVLAAAYALAGTVGRDTNGEPPSDLGPSANAATKGVTLNGAIGCRCSIRLDAGDDPNAGVDGIAASGWRMVPYYYNDSLGWVEPLTALHQLPNARLDGGRIRKMVFPDLEPLASFGRISCVTYGPVGYDGGSGRDLRNDGGNGDLPKVRTECWGPSMSSTP